MLNVYDRLSERSKGVVLLVVGTLLLMNTLGITWFKPIVVICSAYLIFRGLVKVEAYKQFMALLNNKNK